MASRAIEDADPDLADGFRRIKRIFEAVFSAYELRLTCTHRSPDEQRVAFDAGRSRFDGTTRKSKHNFLPSRAVDVGIFRRNPGGVPSAYIDDLLAAGKFSHDLHKSLYWNVAQLAQRFGFRSGNDWNDNAMPVEPDPAESLVDPYHMELR